MTTFRIDAENNITAMGGSKQTEESGGENRNVRQSAGTDRTGGEVVGGAAGGDLEEYTRCAASAAIHQPPSGDHADMECPSAPWAQGRQRDGTRRDEKAKGGQEGTAGSAKRAWRRQQDNSCDRP